MSLTILLTGKNGQVGRELTRTLAQIGTVVALDRHQLDLTNPDNVREVIRSVRPQLIINAAAYTAVDKAESEEALARIINADAPALMAEEAKKLGATLVHFSTDYIFDGSKRAPYVEDDLPNPQNAYGRSKLAGEEAIRLSGVPHLIFRTEWVYSQEGRNFLLTILRLATEREELKIVNDQIGAPTWSREIAATTVRILSQYFGKKRTSNDFSKVSGIYHMTAGGETNWFQFAEAILDEARQIPQHEEWFTAAIHGLPLIVKRVVPITTSDHPTPARRPAYSVLSNVRLACTFNTMLPGWRTQLRSLFAGGKNTDLAQ